MKFLKKKKIFDFVLLDEFLYEQAFDAQDHSLICCVFQCKFKLLLSASIIYAFTSEQEIGGFLKQTRT